MITETTKRDHPLKGKIAVLYETVFKPTLIEQQRFWDELFLLKPDLQALKSELQRFFPFDQHSKEALQTFTFSCIEFSKNDNLLRCAHAIQTLTLIFDSLGEIVRHQEVQQKAKALIDLTFGHQNVEEAIQTMSDRFCQILLESESSILVVLQLRLFLTISVMLDNVNENPFLNYLMQYSVFESLLHLMSNRKKRQRNGIEALLLLVILVNFRKYNANSVNPYVVKLSIADDELALNGYSNILLEKMCKKNMDAFQNLKLQQSGVGFWSRMVDAIGSAFVGSDESENIATGSSLQSDTDEAMLLAFYEAVHLNRNFITNLTTTVSAELESNLQQEENEEAISAAHNGKLTAQNGTANDLSGCCLLEAFITQTSVVFGTLKTTLNDENHIAKLCAIILTCIVEDQYANTLMHDVNLTFKVQLYRPQMRHRQGSFEKPNNPKPLACAMLDLCNEFFISHLMKNLPVDLYRRMLGVVHRILCFEKKFRVRLDYHWPKMWDTLHSLLKFLTNSEAMLAESGYLFTLSYKVVTIINLFVTFGDTFLPSPMSYDELYYEIIRSADVYNNLHSLALRHGSVTTPNRDLIVRLCSSLGNIRSIIGHFQLKIDQGLQTTAVTRHEVLSIVRANYGSLVLRLQENLDTYERYNGKLNEVKLFSALVHRLVWKARRDLEKYPTDPKLILQELMAEK